MIPNTLMTDDTARIVRCPTCRNPAKATSDNGWRPFCSRRCKLIDLGEWLHEDRHIPGQEPAPGYPEEPE